MEVLIFLIVIGVVGYIAFTKYKYEMQMLFGVGMFALGFMLIIRAITIEDNVAIAGVVTLCVLGLLFCFMSYFIIKEIKQEKEQEPKRLAEQKHEKYNLEYEQGIYYNMFEFLKKSLMQEANSEYYHKLGYMYENGYGTTKDYDKAMQCYKKADAWREIGYMYYFGHGVSKSKDKAKEYFAKCYDEAECEEIISYFERIENYNDSNAYFNLGLCYADGDGVMRDYQKARYYYQKAANLGNASACNNLANMYKNGRGGYKSFSTAVSYYKTAADMGNAVACNNLGQCYEYGEGGLIGALEKKDKYQALKYYKKAYDLGNKDGCENYQRLKNEMGITNDDAVLF